MSLAGKVALVSGAAGGIGKETVRALTDAGAVVAAAVDGLAHRHAPALPPAAAAKHRRARARARGVFIVGRTSLSLSPSLDAVCARPARARAWLGGGGQHHSDEQRADE